MEEILDSVARSPDHSALQSSVPYGSVQMTVIQPTQRPYSQGQVWGEHTSVPKHIRPGLSEAPGMEYETLRIGDTLFSLRLYIVSSSECNSLGFSLLWFHRVAGFNCHLLYFLVYLFSIAFHNTLMCSLEYLLCICTVYYTAVHAKLLCSVF